MRKLSRFQSTWTRSRTIAPPRSGGLGRMASAACSCSTRQTPLAVPTIAKTMLMAIPASIRSGYARYRSVGKWKKPL